MRKISSVGLAIVTFLLGISICFIGQHLVHRLLHVTPANVVEEQRVGDPSGRFDAVIIAEYHGGAIGGIDWNVYIVPKAKPAPFTGRNRSLFHASTLDHEKLSWRQPHLLEIQYDRAYIERFSNLWASDMIENVGAEGQGDYYVEVRLAPLSPDFSIVTPGNSFR